MIQRKGKAWVPAAVVAAAWLLAAPGAVSAWCEGQGTPGECRCRERSESAARFSGVNVAAANTPGAPHPALAPPARQITAGNTAAVEAAAGAVVIVHVYDTDFSTNPQGQPVMDPVIQVGDTIRWVFDSGFHTVTNTAGSGETFDSGGRFQGDPPFEHTFTSVGTFDYYCTFHGVDLGGAGVIGMAGTVTVVVPEPRAAGVVLLALAALLAPRRRVCALVRRPAQPALRL